MISSTGESARVAEPQCGRRIAWTLRKSWRGPLVRVDWSELTAFNIVSLFHQKQRGVKLMVMIDQNDDRLRLWRAPPSKLVSDCGGFSSDRQRPPAGTDGLCETKHLVSTKACRALSPMNPWTHYCREDAVEQLAWSSHVEIGKDMQSWQRQA